MIIRQCLYLYLKERKESTYGPFAFSVSGKGLSPLWFCPGVGDLIIWSLIWTLDRIDVWLWRLTHVLSRSLGKC